MTETIETTTGPTVGQRVRTAARGALGLAGSAIRLVTGLFAAILLVHVALTVLGANPIHVVTRLFAGLADSLTLGLSGLFVLTNPLVQVVVSYGIPALAWLAIGSVAVAILRRIARPRSGLR